MGQNWPDFVTHSFFLSFSYLDSSLRSCVHLHSIPLLPPSCPAASRGEGQGCTILMLAHSAVVTHVPAFQEPLGGEGDDEEEKSIVLDDLEDLDDTEFQLYGIKYEI